MALYSVPFQSVAQTGTADTVNLVDSTYAAYIRGGSATQLIKILEVNIAGEAGASAPTPMVLARNSTGASGTVGGTPANLLDAAATAPANAPVAGNTAATTKPQRSATAHLLQLTLNAYGGAAKYVADSVKGGPSIISATAPLGEASLSSNTQAGAGTVSGHVIIEVV